MPHVFEENEIGSPIEKFYSPNSYYFIIHILCIKR